jgi:hypothetical protein
LNFGNIDMEEADRILFGSSCKPWRLRLLAGRRTARVVALSARVVVAHEAGCDGFSLARWLRMRMIPLQQGKKSQNSAQHENPPMLLSSPCKSRGTFRESTTERVVEELGDMPEKRLKWIGFFDALYSHRDGRSRATSTQRSSRSALAGATCHDCLIEENRSRLKRHRYFDQQPCLEDGDQPPGCARKRLN